MPGCPDVRSTSTYGHSGLILLHCPPPTAFATPRRNWDFRITIQSVQFPVKGSSIDSKEFRSLVAVPFCAANCGQDKLFLHSSEIPPFVKALVKGLAASFRSPGGHLEFQFVLTPAHDEASLN